MTTEQDFTEAERAFLNILHVWEPIGGVAAEKLTPLQSQGMQSANIDGLWEREVVNKWGDDLCVLTPEGKRVVEGWTK
jgi:hypothetical protein